MGWNNTENLENEESLQIKFELGLINMLTLVHGQVVAVGGFERIYSGLEIDSRSFTSLCNSISWQPD